MKEQFIRDLERLRNLSMQKPKQVPEKLRGYGFGSQGSDLGPLQDKLLQTACSLCGAYAGNRDNRRTSIEILRLSEQPLENIDRLLELAKTLPVASRGIRLGMPKNIPAEISSEIAADLNELEKAFTSQCYRAATILCGRILETCLHRKYYEITGNDILEKNPGIGLGKLIAKLAEREVVFDPGLTQQIHLVNQVRIHSVHVKKESFHPSPQQTHAMILYTLDVVERMF